MTTAGRLEGTPESGKGWATFAFRSRSACVARLALPLAAALTASCVSMPLPGRTSDRVLAFTAPWDARSAASLAANADALDAVASGWIMLDSANGTPVQLYADTASGATQVPRRMAMVTSFAGSRFHPESIRLLAADPAALGHAARALADIGRAAHYEGFVLDFEGMSRDDLVALHTVTRAIRDSVHAHGMRNVWLAVPAMDTASYPSAALLQVADRLIVMLYDQHWAGSSAGPIADPDWARAALAARVADVGPSRLVAALPLYGYRWRANTDGAVVSYPEAVRFAAEAGTALSRDPVSGTLNARKPNDSTEVWVSDANQLARLIAQVRSVGVSRIALWRLGLEDPGVWGVVRR